MKSIRIAPETDGKIAQSAVRYTDAATLSEPNPDYTSIIFGWFTSTYCSLQAATLWKVVVPL